MYIKFKKMRFNNSLYICILHDVRLMFRVILSKDVFFFQKFEIYTSHKTIYKAQRRNDVRIKYRGYLIHNFPTPCRFRCREATCSPLQYNCTFCVSSIRKISECFATSSEAFYKACEIKGQKVTRLQLYLCALFILSHLFSFL